MKWDEFRTTNFSGFLKSCLADLDWTRQCWEQAEDPREFCKKFFTTTDQTVTTSQGYAGLSKKMSARDHNEHCKLMLGKADERLVTDSDRAGLKVGNDNFSVLVPNDGQDGETRTYVFKKDNGWFNPDLLDECRYFAALEGIFSIYENDCNGEKICDLSGKFFIYTAKNGKIIFDEWEN